MGAAITILIIVEPKSKYYLVVAILEIIIKLFKIIINNVIMIIITL